MNVGQILETHMGWAARGLGINVDEALQEYKRSGDLTPVREAMLTAMKPIAMLFQIWMIKD